jgi:hypothetical protein
MEQLQITKYLLIIGGEEESFTCVGPFDSEINAINYGVALNQEYWMVKRLEQPKIRLTWEDLFEEYDGE